MCVISNRSACNKSCLRVSSKRAKLHLESFMTSIHARRSRCVVPRDGQTSGYDAQAAIPHMLLASLASLKPPGTMPRQRYHTCCWRPWPASNLRVRCPGSDTTHVVGVPGETNVPVLTPRRAPAENSTHRYTRRHLAKKYQH